MARSSKSISKAYQQSYSLKKDCLGSEDASAKKTEAALELMQQCCQAADFNQQGVQQFKASKLLEAAEHFDKAITCLQQIETDNDCRILLACCYYNLGTTDNQLNNLSDAKEHYQRCYMIRKEILGDTNEATKKVLAKLNSLEETLTGTVTSPLFSR